MVEDAVGQVSPNNRSAVHFSSESSSPARPLVSASDGTQCSPSAQLRDGGRAAAAPAPRSPAAAPAVPTTCRPSPGARHRPIEFLIGTSFKRQRRRTVEKITHNVANASTYPSRYGSVRRKEAQFKHPACSTCYQQPVSFGRSIRVNSMIGRWSLNSQLLDRRSLYRIEVCLLGRIKEFTARLYNAAGMPTR